MFPARLESLRKDRKLTQKQIADMLGIARTTYSGYENGTREPDHEILQKIADFFEVSIDYLLGRTNNPLTEKEMSRLRETAPTNDAETTIRLLEEEARRMGLEPDDPKFLKMLSDAFELLRLARGQDKQ